MPFFTVLQLLMLQPTIVYTEAEPPTLKALVMDPYIILAAGKNYLRNEKSYWFKQKKCLNITLELQEQ